MVTFREAARRLGHQVTTADIARALDVSHHTVRQARLEEGAPGYRTPPAGWQEALASLVDERIRDLEELRAQLVGAHFKR